MVSTEKHINIVYTVKIKYKNSPYTAQTHHKHRTNPTQTQKNTTQVQIKHNPSTPYIYHKHSQNTVKYSTNTAQIQHLPCTLIE